MLVEREREWLWLSAISEANICKYYVYWTVHHLDSWIKRDQLDVTCLLFNYLMLNMFRMLVHPSSGACDFLLNYFMGCIALVRCVLELLCGMAVVVWYPYAGWGTSAYGYHTTTAIPQHNTNTHRTRANTTHEITQQISRKLLRMDVLTSETCWALNNEIMKQVTTSWSLFIQLFVNIFPTTEGRRENISCLRFMYLEYWQVSNCVFFRDFTILFFRFARKVTSCC